MSDHQLPGRIHDLMGEWKDQFVRSYSHRLKGVYLYGSYARGEEEMGSDVDVLIVLDRIDSYAAEIERTGEIASDLSLKYGLSISRVFVDRENWQEGGHPFSPPRSAGGHRDIGKVLVGERYGPFWLLWVISKSFRYLVRQLITALPG